MSLKIEVVVEIKIKCGRSLKNPLLPVTSAKIDVIQCYMHCVSVQFGPSNNLDSTVL